MIKRTESNVALTLDEALELKQFEGEIERGLKHFVAVGAALGLIRDRRLYRSAYPTFEDYCEQRWQIGRSRAYQFIESAQVFENVHNCGHAPPANEAQSRALSAIKDPVQQREAWTKAVDSAPDGHITAKHVAEVVRQIQGIPAKTPSEAGPLTLHEAIGLIRPRVYSVYESWPAGKTSVLVQQLRDLADELELNGELCP